MNGYQPKKPITTSPPNCGSSVHSETRFKPPLGLEPKWLHDEGRLNDITDALIRYIDAGMAIPLQWIEEYNELIINRRKPERTT